MPRLAADDPRLTAADFPHGTPVGYGRGCSCLDCRSANAAATAVRKARLTGKPLGDPQGSRVDGTAAREHIEKLLAADPHIKPQHVAKASGVTPTAVTDLLHGYAERISALTEEYLLGTTLEAVQAISTKLLVPAGPVREHILKLMAASPLATAPNIGSAAGLEGYEIRHILTDRASVHRETAKAITAVTPARLERCAARVPARIPRMQARALQAQGFTLRALGEMCGVAHGLAWVPLDTEFVAQHVARRMARIYQEVGDREGPSQRTKDWARRNGFYPAIHYDEDMNLIPGSLPGRREECLTTPADRARINLRIMGLTLHEQTGTEIAAKVGYSAKKVERVRRQIGLRLDAAAVESVLVDFIKPGQEALVGLIHQHVADIALYESTPLVDARGLDYVALWDSLVIGAERLRAEVEAWEEYAAREVWDTSALGDVA